MLVEPSGQVVDKLGKFLGHQTNNYAEYMGLLMGLKRVSRPGLRVYTKRSDIPRVFGGVGTSILSTPRGVMTGEQARRLGVGGEVLCHVW